LRALLPREGEGFDLSPELKDLLHDGDEHSPPSLRTLQAFSMHQLQSLRSESRPGQSFIQLLSAGDYGYIPGGSMDLAKFVLLGNIQENEYRKEITQVIAGAECKLYTPEYGTVICHRSRPTMATSTIPDERDSWQVPLPPSGPAEVRIGYWTVLNSVKHAQEFLVAQRASLALKDGVKARDLILGMSWGYLNTSERAVMF
jgi:hypothetical protein